MKKYIFPILILGALISMSGCATTEQLVLNTLEPSPVSISNAIKKIGIIDRSGQAGAIKGRKKIDRILKAEEQWLIENGTDAAITGLFDELLKDERFEIIKILDEVPVQMQAIGTDPDSIAWSSIKALCEENGVDAIFSLAFYETDTKVSLKKTKMSQFDMMREKKEVSAQELTLETLIENGWRIYDPKNQELVDEIVFNDQIISKGKGVTPILAYRAIEDRKVAMLEHSKTHGANYGQRLLPYENAVSRTYFVKGSDKLVLASESTAAGNWHEAVALWEQETENPNAKIKSRAFHNLAVASEKGEDLNRALAWATMAYEAVNDERYLAYINTLNKRLENQRILQKQVMEIELSK